MTSLIGWVRKIEEKLQSQSQWVAKLEDGMKEMKNRVPELMGTCKSRARLGGNAENAAAPTLPSFADVKAIAAKLSDDIDHTLSDLKLRKLDCIRYMNVASIVYCSFKILCA